MIQESELNLPVIAQSYAASNLRPVSKKQLAAVHIILDEHLGQCESRADKRTKKLRVLSDLFGRVITSSKELTAGQAQSIWNLNYNPATAERFHTFVQAVK